MLTPVDNWGIIRPASQETTARVDPHLNSGIAHKALSEPGPHVIIVQ